MSKERPKAQGWAVVSDGKINVRTVSDTRRAALVNWLVVEAGARVAASWTDEDIERTWHENCGQAVCTVVTIEQTNAF